jgi:hypothetical protein
MEYITDENGKWEVNGNIKILIEPSQKYIDEHPEEPIPELGPTSLEITQAEVEKNLALSMFNAALLEDAINDLDSRLNALNA